MLSFSVEIDWIGANVQLRVPAVIADRLLSGQTWFTLLPPGDADNQSTSTPTMEVPAEGIFLGAFDDGPISERRMLTSSNLRMLRANSYVGDQPHLVCSAERGVEILPLSSLEERCSAGWRGIILTAAADLPTALVESKHRDLLRYRDQSAGSDWYTRDLSEDDGERLLARLSRTEVELEHGLRCLSLARAVPDLRSLYEEDRPRRDHSIPNSVWGALLTTQRLDLRPFGLTRPGLAKSGLNLPLAMLATVQIYSVQGSPDDMPHRASMVSMVPVLAPTVVR